MDLIDFKPISFSPRPLIWPLMPIEDVKPQSTYLVNTPDIFYDLSVLTQLMFWS